MNKRRLPAGRQPKRRKSRVPASGCYMNWIAGLQIPACRVPAVPALEGAFLGNGASTALDPRVNTPGAWRFWDQQMSSFGIGSVPGLFPRAIPQEVFAQDTGIIEHLMQRRR